MTAAGRGLDRDGALAALDAGQVLLLQTDTLPGLHARLDRPEALDTLNRLKGRPQDQPLLVLVASLADALALTEPLPPRVKTFLQTCWPGPFTAVLRAIAPLPAAVVAAGGTVAIRVPARPELRDFLSVSGPLASTSANLAGQPAAQDMTAARLVFPQLAAWVSAPTAGLATASALVDLTGERPRLLRAGPQPLPAWPDDV